MSLTAFPVAQTVSIIVEVTGFVNNSILFLYHSYYTIKLKQWISNLEWLSLCLLFLNMSFGFFLTLTSFSLQPRFISCKIFTDIITSNYLLTKIALYSLFLERLFSVFKGTPYSFKPRNIYISRCMLLLYILGLIILVFITGQGYYDPIHDSCYEDYPLWIHGIAACGDLIIGITTSILFTRRLMLLRISTNNPFIERVFSHTDTHKEISKSNESPHSNKDENNQKQNQNQIPSPTLPSTKNVTPVPITNIKRSNSNRKIMNVMMQDTMIWKALNKFTLLTFISVFTTLISIILAGIFELAALWISIDTIINCWCVLLCFKVHRKMYRFICCGNGRNLIGVKCLSWYSCNCCCPIIAITTNNKSDLTKPPKLAKSTTTLSSYTSKTETQCENNDAAAAAYEKEQRGKSQNVSMKLDNINLDGDDEPAGILSDIPTNSYQTEIEMEERTPPMPPTKTESVPQRSIADNNGSVQIIR